jgi:hypothetical protein
MPNTLVNQLIVVGELVVSKNHGKRRSQKAYQSQRNYGGFGKTGDGVAGSVKIVFNDFTRKIGKTGNERKNGNGRRKKRK